MSAKHTPGAVKAAEVITGGVYGETKTYPTTYGRKNVQGIADLIERETGLDELLQASKAVLRHIEACSEGKDTPEILRAAIKTAEGGTG